MARILVVDDDVGIRELLRAVLEPEGYEVSEAENGSEGLQRYQGAPTDLVIIDMQMPGMDGLVLMLTLQRAFPRVKVIAISGEWRRLEVARTFTPHTLQKPFTLEAVRAAVSRALQAGTCAKTP
jgi:CheY-like chemotaxis protein